MKPLLLPDLVWCHCAKSEVLHVPLRARAAACTSEWQAPLAHFGPRHARFFSFSAQACWLSMTIHLHQWSGGFIPWTLTDRCGSFNKKKGFFLVEHRRQGQEVEDISIFYYSLEFFRLSLWHSFLLLLLMSHVDCGQMIKKKKKKWFWVYVRNIEFKISYIQHDYKSS